MKIAFMSNLERSITATAAAWEPGPLDRWDLQGGGADGVRAQHANTKQIFPLTASQSLRS